MSYIGKTPTSVPLTSSDIEDGIISTDKLAANAVVTSKITDATISNADVNATVVTGQTAETSIADGDTILIHDASASALRKMTKANFVSGVGESNTPSFFARGDGATAIPNATLTVIKSQSEQFDNGGCYNATASSATLNSLTCPAYAFTPNVAGLYYFIGAIKLNSGTFNLGLVNNKGGTGGSESYACLKYFRGTANNTVMVQGFSVMNGSGNNVSLCASHEDGGSISTNDAFYTTYFGGFLVKKS